MPNIKSAIKRMRSNERKAARNGNRLSELHTLKQKLKELASDPKKAQEVAQLTISRYDRAVSKGVIPRGRADRQKSRIQKFLTRIQQKKKK